MSAQFYNRMKGIADRLLTEYGHTIELLNSTQTVLDTYQGLKAPVRVENAPQTVIERSTATVYVTYGTVVPDTTHYLRMDGSIWKILWVAPVRPTDVGILYTLYVTQGG